MVDFFVAQLVLDSVGDVFTFHLQLLECGQERAAQHNVLPPLLELIVLKAFVGNELHS